MMTLIVEDQIPVSPILMSLILPIIEICFDFQSLPSWRPPFLFKLWGQKKKKKKEPLLSVIPNAFAFALHKFTATYFIFCVTCAEPVTNISEV